MPFHLSLIACDRGLDDIAGVREALSEFAVAVWANPGVVAVLVLADDERCGLLTTWRDQAAFVAWQQRIGYRRVDDYFSGLSATAPHRFDCGFFETDLVPPDTVRGTPASIVPLRSPSR